MVPAAIVVLQALPLIFRTGRWTAGRCRRRSTRPTRTHATFDQELSIRTVFSMPTLEAMAREIERRIHEEVAGMSEFEAEPLAESYPVAGA
jgi:hypothetical protein